MQELYSSCDAFQIEKGIHYLALERSKRGGFGRWKCEEEEVVTMEEDGIPRRHKELE